MLARLAFCLLMLGAAPSALSAHSPSETSQKDDAPSRANPASQESQPDAELVRAKALLEKNVPTEAEAVVRQYLTNHSTSADAHFLLGEILFKEIQAAERSKVSSSGVRVLQTTDPHSNTKSSKVRESLAAYSQGAKYRQPGAFELKMIALDYVLLGDYADADQWITQSLQQNASDADGWYDLGRIKYNENRFAEAIPAFHRCLALDKKNVKAADNLGLSYAALGRTDEAIAAYKNAIEWQSALKFKNAGPYIDLGSLYVDMTWFAEAVPHLLEAVRIAPLDAKAHEKLGKTYYSLNQLTQARMELEKATEISPDNPALHFLLGQIYRKEGLTEKAKQELDLGAALSGTHSIPETPRP